MIRSANHFFQLCKSQHQEDLDRSLSDEAELETWVEILEKFPQLQMDVAQNRTIQDEVMQLLSTSKSESVRCLIAEKRRLPKNIFHLLHNDNCDSVRRVIAANKKTPIELIKLLTTDPVENVASVASFNLKQRSDN